MKLSVIIPAHNEAGLIEGVISDIAAELAREKIDFEIIVVDDNSDDGTHDIVSAMAAADERIRLVKRTPPKGFGRAIREGLEKSTGDAVVVAMGDASDDPADITRYFRKIGEGYDCVFGSRFMEGSEVRDYPALKLIINRAANLFLRCIFWTGHNDLTNAFKAYRRDVIEAIKPIESMYFNVTIEMPLKALIRDYKIAVIPVKWHGRESGVSKLKIADMGRRYLYTALYLWLQRVLVMDDIKERTRL